MLPAQLSLALQPVVEQSLLCHNDFQRLQGDVLVSLGFVVAVQLLQLLVEQLCKETDVRWLPRKLYEPLVPALGLSVHEHGSGGVLHHLGARFTTSVGQSLLGIVHDEFLAEGVDIVLGASGDDELIGVFRSKAHGVAYHVAPQSARRADEHRVVSAHLHVPEGHNASAVGVAAVGSARLHLHELIEHTVVEHEQHRLVCGVILYAEETLAGVVGLHVVHVWRRYQLFILLPVWREGHAAMEEYLQVGPHLVEVFLARQLHDTGEHGEHPRRNTAEVGHVLVERLLCDALAFLLEIAEQSRGLLRHAHQIGQGIDVFYEDGTEVSDERMRQCVVGSMAASEYERTAVEEPALGIVAQIKRHHIGAAGVMNMPQTVAAHGNKLRLVVGRSRRLGVPSDLPRPQHVSFSVTHAVNVGLERLIVAHRNMLCEALVAVDGREQMLAPELRVARLADEILQHLLLHLGAVVLVSLQFLQPRIEHVLNDSCQTHS